jgi:hypothetical protein
MARVKRTFNLLEEANDALDRLLATQSASTESAALAQILFNLDESLRRFLDLQALALYERAELTRGERQKALQRYQEREAAKKATNGEQVPAAMTAA